jgi:hypothetical protein
LSNAGAVYAIQAIQARINKGRQFLFIMLFSTMFFSMLPFSH